MADRILTQDEFFEHAKGVLNAARGAYGVFTDNKLLGATFRQGIDELGQALKAFPDSIQQHEYGTVFDPYPSDAAKDRNADHGIADADHSQGRDVRHTGR